MIFKNLLNRRFIFVFAIGFLIPIIIIIIVLRDNSPWSSEVKLKGLPDEITGDNPKPLNPLWNDIKGIVVFTGDIMQHIRQKGDDFNRSYSLIKQELSVADIVIGNLEFPIDVSQPIGPYFGTDVFNGDASHLDALVSVGFNGLSIANNHIFDRGMSGFEKTLLLFKERKVLPIGLAEPGQNGLPLLEPTFFDVRGIRFAVLGATYAINIPSDDYPPLDFPVVSLPFNYSSSDYRSFMKKVFVRSVLLARREGAKALVLYAHWGEEWNFAPLTSQIDAAGDAFTAGFDLIIGSHPHVIGPVKRIKNNFVVTSLGNFISDFKEREVAVGAMAYIGLNETGNIHRLGILPLFVLRSDGRGKPLHLVIPLNNRRKEELLKKIAEHGIKDGENIWNYSKKLSRTIFGSYCLDEPPQRHLNSENN